MAVRQMTNWASRAGFTEFTRNKMKSYKYGNPDAKLSVKEEAVCGMIGGALACWNHPIEVCRIEMQSRTVSGESALSLGGTISHVVKNDGVMGLFKGLYFLSLFFSCEHFLLCLFVCLFLFSNE